MNSCPSCGKTALPVWKKTLIGTNTRIKCRSCGTEVSIAPLEILWALPLAAAIAISFATSDVTARALLWTAGLVIGTVVKGALAPLIRSMSTPVENPSGSKPGGPSVASDCQHPV